MKSSFKKFLPIVAAVLLATSCGKDDDSNVASVDEVTTPDPVQEVVDNTTKTITITGKVSKESLSKVTVDGGAFAYQPDDDVFAFNDATHGVSGNITIEDVDGNYTAEITYTDAAELTSNTFTAALGNNPTELVGGPYDDIEKAVQAARYEIPFKVVGTPGSYSLKREDGTGDVLVYTKSAFIKSSATRTIKINGSDVDVSINKCYVVSIENTMGTGTTNPVPGKVYTVNKLAGKISYGDGEVSVTKKLGLSPENLYMQEFTTNHCAGEITYQSSDPSVAVYLESEQKIWVKKVGTTIITATVTNDDTYQYEEGDNIASYTLNVTPPTGFVDLGMTDYEGKDVYWDRDGLTSFYESWDDITIEESGTYKYFVSMPTKEEIEYLIANCYFVYEVWQKGQEGEISCLRLYIASNESDKNGNNGVFASDLPTIVYSSGDENTETAIANYEDAPFVRFLIDDKGYTDEKRHGWDATNNCSYSKYWTEDLSYILNVSSKYFKLESGNTLRNLDTPTPLWKMIRHSQL